MMMSRVVWAQEAVFTHVISDDVDDWDRWFLVELPVQGRLYSIFVSRVGLPDIHEFSAG